MNEHLNRSTMRRTSHETATKRESLLESIRRLAQDLLRVGRAQAVLAVLEMQQAASCFVRMLAAGIAATMLAVAAWLLLVVGVVAWIAAATPPWPAICLWAALINALVALVLAWVARREVIVPFAATLRQLRADEAALRRNDPPPTAG